MSSLIVTPGRIVLVRLKHGWRTPGIVITGCADWQEGHRISVRCFSAHSGPLGIMPVEKLWTGGGREGFTEMVKNVEAAGIEVSAPVDFVLEDVPRASPDDETTIGWFFPQIGRAHV